MLTIWSSSFFLKRKRKVVGREKKKEQQGKNKGLKRYTFGMSGYKGECIEFSPFTKTKIV